MEIMLDEGNMNESQPPTTTTDTLADDLPALVAMTVYMSLLAIMGLIGNILVIVSVAISPRLRTTSYAFIVNLSVTDLAVNVLVIPVMTVSFYNYGWPHIPFWCRFVAYIFCLSIGISFVTLTMIAANRYSLVSCSRRVRLKYCGWKGTTLCLFFNWFSAFCLVLFQEFYYKATVRYDTVLRFCYPDSSEPATYWYLSAILIYGTLIGFILIPILYCKTFHSLQVSRRRTETWARPAGKTRPRKQNNQSQRRVHPAEVKLTKLMAVIFTVIIICWTPLWVVHFFKLTYDIPKGVERLCILLVLTNSSINPYLYAWLNKNFLRAYKKVLLCGRNRKDQFYEELNTTIRGIPVVEQLYLLGEFNARVGSDHNSCPAASLTLALAS
ncbi:neuropeptides B/W receptor type 2-like [Patiria miniata]|uniref:G-protein coupled receptors family 1 profile domain-containing protein n=1 Tax=Patiria miniata TaxID=46514 RepID=A0A914AKE5_PATMI|nr:neuropeptides B/W receptor type 2-like [Patiria miniata]